MIGGTPLSRAGGRIRVLLGAAVLLAACSSPSPSPVESVPASALASASPSASVAAPSPTAEPTSAPTPIPTATRPPPLPPPLHVDAIAEVVVPSLNLRDGPSLASARLGTLAAGYRGFVVRGPVAADGYDWYELATLGLRPFTDCVGPIQTTPYSCPSWFGWVAARGVEGPAWLEEVAIDCPTPTPGIEIGTIAYGKTVRELLSCYGNQTIEMRVPWENGDAATRHSCLPDYELAWLACPQVGIVDDQSLAIILATFSPEHGIGLPDYGPDLLITGAFDYPDATSCVSSGGVGHTDDEAVLFCRSAFVITGVALAP